MKNKLSFVVGLIFLTSGSLFSQSLQYSGGLTVGSYVDIYLTSSGSCTSVVNSASSWSISPSPSSLTIDQNNLHARASWSSGTSVSVSVTYHCSQNPGANSVTAGPISFTIQTPVPSFDLSIGGPSICEGDGILAQAINITNQGSTPNFTWLLDGTDMSNIVHSGSASSYTVPTTGLTTGSHTLWMRMYSSKTGTTVMSAPQGFNVVARTHLNAILYVNGSICPNNPVAKASVNVTGGASPYSYQWYRNGSPVATTSTSYYDYTNVTQGDEIYCKVTASNSSVYWCTDSPASTNLIKVDIDSATPTVSITTPQPDYCVGGSIIFSSSKQASTYSWKLIYNNVVKVTGSSRDFQLYATNDPANLTDFGPNATVTLDVTGLSSSGCVGNMYAASSYINGSNLNIRSLPMATLSPSGTVVFCTTCVPVLTASAGTNYTYQWLKGSFFIPNQTNATLTTDIEDTYKVQVSDIFCSNVSAAVVLKRNTLPQVNAGPDQRLALPLSSVSVPGTASDAEGPLVYAWTQIYDPNSPAITLSGTNTPTLVLTDLFVGVYRFRLTVTDNTNESRFDEIKIIIDPPNNYNYVKENILNVSGIIDYSDVASLPIGSRNETVHYGDGLGRTLQTVASQESPLRKDIVQPAEYDEYGREKKKFLPYVTNEVNGWYKVDPLHTGANYIGSPYFQFYQNGIEDKIADDSLAYAETTFEASPLNRPDKQYGAGINWHAASKYIQHNSLQNDHGTAPGQEQIIHWVIDAAGNLATSSANGAYYPSGTLSITSTKDEHGNETREYVDSYGRMICRKVQSETTPTSVFAETYYVYDDLGNLTVVLPPESVVKMKNLISQN